jgi:hypothetical protein
MNFEFVVERFWIFLLRFTEKQKIVCRGLRVMCAVDLYTAWNMLVRNL